MRYQNYEWEVRSAPVESFPGAPMAWVAYVVGLWYRNDEEHVMHIPLRDNFNRVGPTESDAHAQCDAAVKDWVDKKPVV